MDIRELYGLDPERAQELLLAYSTDVKRYEKELATIAQDLVVWKRRVELATSKGMPELARAAEAKVAEIGDAYAKLEGEKAGLVADIARIREALPGIRARQRSVDPDLLLGEMQILAGGTPGEEPSEAEREIAGLESGSKVDDALSALKRRIGESGGKD